MDKVPQFHRNCKCANHCGPASKGQQGVLCVSNNLQPPKQCFTAPAEWVSEAKKGSRKDHLSFVHRDYYESSRKAFINVSFNKYFALVPSDIWTFQEV